MNTSTSGTCELEKFLGWALKKIPTIGFIPHNAPMKIIESVYGVTLYRRGSRQVEMFIVPPNYIIPEHTHPNVDSFEVYLGGEINFSHRGKWVSPRSEQGAARSGLSNMRGKTIRVRPSDPHGATFGPTGGVFLSVQQWLNGVKPTSVAYDYDGTVMGADHLASVTSGNPKLKANLTAKDAASEE